MLKTENIFLDIWVRGKNSLAIIAREFFVEYYHILIYDINPDVDSIEYNTGYKN
jgi:hypothetical protein